MQLAEVAHLYYIKNLTQEHIAGRIGMSRSNVSRMLKEARAGLLNVLITDEDTAAAEVLDILKGEEAPAELGAGRA